VRFFTGLLLGFVATGVNFGILYAVVRWLVRGQEGMARYIAPLAQVGRYIIFAAIIFLAVRYRLGSVWGLLAGVTIGIAGFLVWQVVTNARNRRSS
jgi:fatty acid desaturase